MINNTILNNFNNNPFFQSDIWDLRYYNVESILQDQKRTGRYATFRFDSLDKEIKQELKYYFYKRIISKLSAGTLKNDSHFLSHITNYVNEKNVQSIKDINIKECVDFLSSKNSYSDKSRLELKVKNLQIFYHYEHQFKDYFEREIWDLNELNISKDRVSTTRKITLFNFSEIENKENVTLLKQFIKYQILNTQFAISTISGKIINNKILLDYLKVVNLVNLNKNILENYLESIKPKYKATKYNSVLSHNIEFLNFLVEKGYLKESYINHNYKLKENRKINTRVIDNEVIKQIFNCLDKIPSNYSLIFLLMYTTGMRVSEACSIKLNSMYKNENNYFIKFYQQKMKKEVSNPIPKSLYDLLLIQQKKVIDKFTENEIFLFPTSYQKEMSSVSFRLGFKEIYQKLNIQLPSGEEFNFKPHDLRHTYATELLESEVPFHLIQKALHHESPEMTVQYAEIQDTYKFEKYKKFVDLTGKEHNINFAKEFKTEKDIDEISKLQWIRKNILAQALPNGYCGLPVALGKCPSANACLTCDKYFRTNEHFLNQHKEHLRRTEEIMDLADKNNWQTIKETNLIVKDNLEKLISSLEKRIGNI